MKRVREGCIMEGCENLSHTKRIRGMCNMHKMRVRRTGSVGEPEKRTHPKLQCPIGRCDRITSLGRSYCSKHYTHWKRWGHVFRKPECFARECSRIVHWTRKDGKQKWCRRHWLAIQKWGYWYRRCELDNCDEKHMSKGLCNKHYKAMRLSTDIQAKLASILRARICNAMNGQTKAGSAVKYLGCTLAEFKIHLEDQFEKGMTWGNWSHKGWHIDHIKQLGTFDLTDITQFKEANHYSNLRPLWAQENWQRPRK